MTPESLARMLCRDNESCMSDLHELDLLVEKLDAIAEEEAEGLEVDSLEPPLLAHVRDIKSIQDRLRSQTGNDEIALYIIRRALYKKYRHTVTSEITGYRCPICGQPPTLLFYRKTDEGLYTGMMPQARCNCGAEWRIENEWTCPSCMSNGRGAFKILVSSSTGLEVRICRKCGFKMAVARDASGDLHRLHLYTNIILEAVEA
ncbi:MAG: hypothetical protein GSR78_04560 [Desulfurococcales archaeon]|nr:hypothetical protein [Desulfurococcales archaeon]